MTGPERRPADQIVRRPRFFPDAGDRPSTLELFFDLVFVFCIAELARLFRQEPSWSGAGEMALLFVPVWWTWVNVTFCTDRFPTDDVVQRALVLVAAAAAGTMGLALSDLPGHGSTAFAAGYAAARVVVVVLYTRAARAVPDTARQCRWYAGGSSVSAALWLASTPVPPPGRWVVWAIAMVVDVSVPAVIDRRLGLLPVDVHHLPERCSAFVVIVLGESLVSTLTSAVDDPTRHGPALHGPAPAVLALSFVITAELWWGFFDRAAMRWRYQRLEGDDGGRLANIICGYLHFPLVAGVTVVAVGVQLARERADAAIPTGAAVALAAGGAAYLLTMNAMTLVLRLPSADSLRRQRLVLVVALLVLAGVGRSWPSPAYLATFAAVLLLHVAANLRRTRRHAMSTAS